MDIRKLFNDDLPAALAKHVNDVKTIDAKFQVDVTGAGKWFIDASSTGPLCKEGTDVADVTITIAEEDLKNLLENPATNTMKLFFQGKLKIEGSPIRAMKLNKLFEYR